MSQELSLQYPFYKNTDLHDELTDLFSKFSLNRLQKINLRNISMDTQMLHMTNGIDSFCI